MHELKQLAKQLDICIILDSQLSRAVENRPGGSKRPMLSDLRESGSIEQDADMVMILHCDEEDAKNHTQHPTVEFIVAKHREGPTGIAPMSFNKAITRFEISSNNGRES
jgi:replicative DNA helicase